MIGIVLVSSLFYLTNAIFAPREFDPDILSEFIADVTTKSDIDEFHSSMFKALLLDPHQKYLGPDDHLNNSSIQYLSVERLNVAGQQGLCFTRGSIAEWNGSEDLRKYGFSNSSEDPRIVSVGDNVIVSFTVRTGSSSSDQFLFYQRWMAVSYYGGDKAVLLKIPGLDTQQNFVEKNWAPFEKKNKLFFVYCFDPLVILSCSPEQPDCTIVYKDSGVTLPIDTRAAYLRGGSNLVPVSDTDDRYYVGGCHTTFLWKKMYHFYLIVVLDTVEWKIIHLSKPVRFIYEGQPVGWGSHLTLGKVENTLMDVYNDKFIIQDPISLMRVAPNTFQTTVNVRDCVTLLYSLRIPIQDIIQDNGEKPRQPEGYWNNRAKEMSDYLADNVMDALQRGFNLAGHRGSHTIDGRPIPDWRHSHC